MAAWYYPTYHDHYNTVPTWTSTSNTTSTGSYWNNWYDTSTTGSTYYTTSTTSCTTAGTIIYWSPAANIVRPTYVDADNWDDRVYIAPNHDVRQHFVELPRPTQEELQRQAAERQLR